jgi:hypothetical protein
MRFLAARKHGMNFARRLSQVTCTCGVTYNRAGGYDRAVARALVPGYKLCILPPLCQVSLLLSCLVCPFRIDRIEESIAMLNMNL